MASFPHTVGVKVDVGAVVHGRGGGGGVAAAMTPAPPLLAVAGRREQVGLPRRVVPPAVVMPEAAQPTRAAVVRRGRPLPADAQLPKA